MFSQSSKALCCLNKVHLWDNKALEDTWCWFEVNGFSMAHIPKTKLWLFHLFHLLHGVSFSFPHVSPSSCSSPHIPLCSSSAVICYCSIPHHDSVTVWSGVDLGFHTWEWVAVKGAAGLLISQDLFPGGGGVGVVVKLYEGGEEWKPSSSNTGSRIKLYMPRLYQQHVPRHLLYQRCGSACTLSNRFPYLRTG